MSKRAMVTFCVVGFAVIVVVGSIVARYIGLDKGFESALTTALILVTGAYVVLTGRLVSEAREQRLGSVMPILIPDWTGWPVPRGTGKLPARMNIQLTNCGLGPAYDIVLRLIQAEPKQLEAEWATGTIANVKVISQSNVEYLGTGQETNFENLEIELDVAGWPLADPEYSLVILAECSDTYGNVSGSYKYHRCRYNGAVWFTEKAKFSQRLRLKRYTSFK